MRHAACIGGIMKSARALAFASVFRDLSAGFHGLFWHADRMA